MTEPKVSSNKTKPALIGLINTGVIGVQFLTTKTDLGLGPPNFTGTISQVQLQRQLLIYLEITNKCIQQYRK